MTDQTVRISSSEVWERLNKRAAAQEISVDVYVEQALRERLMPSRERLSISIFGVAPGTEPDESSPEWQAAQRLGEALNEQKDKAAEYRHRKFKRLNKNVE